MQFGDIHHRLIAVNLVVNMNNADYGTLIFVKLSMCKLLRFCTKEAAIPVCVYIPGPRPQFSASGDIAKPRLARFRTRDPGDGALVVGSR